MSVTSSPPRLRTRTTGQTRYEKEVARNHDKLSDEDKDPSAVGPWILGDTIGKGTSGRVRLAKHRRHGHIAAIKIVSKATIHGSRMSLTTIAGPEDKALMNIQREMVIMKLIHHPNIMSMYDVYETDTHLYLLLEYVEGGELFDYLVSKGCLPLPEALKYFRQIISGLDYCHSFNICHRDLKPENILLDSEMNVKIADFGMAALSVANPNGLLETSCGSPHYASPEIVAGHAYYGWASDIWSCGVVLFALLTGRLPFDDPNMKALLQKVRLGRFEMPVSLHPQARDLIRRMLVVNPAQRITMREIFNHDLLKMDSSSPLVLTPSHSIGEVAFQSEGDINSTVLQNLVTLFKGSSRQVVIANLLSPVKTWEKNFYFLLNDYTKRQHEEYGNGLSFADEAYDPPLTPTKIPSLTLESNDQQVSNRQSYDASCDVFNPKLTRLDTSAVERKQSSAQQQVSPRRAQGPRPLSTPGHTEALNHSSVTSAPRGRASKPPSSTHTRPRASTIIPNRAPRTTEESQVKEKDRAPRIKSKAPLPKEHSTSPIRDDTVQGLGVTHERPQSPTPRAAKIRNATNTYGFARPTSPTRRTSVDLTGSPKKRAASQRESPKKRAATRHQSMEVPSWVKDNLKGLDFGGEPPLALNFGYSPHKARSTREQKAIPEDQSTETIKNGVGALTLQDSTNTPEKSVGEKRRSLLNMTPKATTVFSDSLTPAKPMSTLPTPPPSVLAKQYKSSSTSVDKENTPMGDKNDPSLVPSPKKQERKADSPLRAPGAWNPSTLESIHRTNKPLPLDLSAASPRLSTFIPLPSSSPKLEPVGQGWFQSFFHVKPAAYRFYSGHTIAATREECAHLLTSFGVLIRQESDEVLKCYVDKIKDVSGQVTTKAVRFRVQITSTSQASTPGIASPRLPAGFSGGCTFSLSQEKGAKSTLEIVARRLRHDWRFDDLFVPEPSPLPRMTPKLGAPTS